MISTYGTYTLIMGKPLTASAVFSSMTVFEMLRDQLHITFWMVPILVQAKVSLERLSDFLNNVREFALTSC